VGNGKDGNRFSRNKGLIVKNIWKSPINLASR
jgi:hypothetical protein